MENLQKLSDKDIILLNKLLSFEYTVTHKFSFSKIKAIYKIDNQNTYEKYMYEYAYRIHVRNKT